MSTRARQQARVQRRLAEVRQQQRARQRRRRVVIASAAAVAVIAGGVLALVLTLGSGGRHAGGTPAVSSGLLASRASMATGARVDGVQCSTSEQSAYHIHAHVAVYVDGIRQVIPADVGIPQNCMYWLHTHDTSGVVHIESPVNRTFTLGDFFAIWGQRLSPGQAGPATGRLTAYVNGRRYQGDPGSIRLRPHAVIQIDIGQDVAPLPYTFAHGL